jgi:uncharacterized protein (DUF1330 family)
MAAFIIGRIEITDPERYAQYMKATPAVIEKYQGRFIARGGEKVCLEGAVETARVVIIEFPTLQHAQEFFNSTDYQQVKSLREGAAIAQFIAIEGLP